MWTKFAKMSVREAMITIAGKPGYGEQPRWFGKIADAANISKRMARSLWRGEILSPDHRAVRAIEREARRIKQEQEARAEAIALARLHQKAIGGMRAVDPDFFREEIARLERLVERIGVQDRT